MRWFWIDRFTEFVSGQYAVAVKAVSLSEEPVDEYAPSRNYFPASLIIEGMAQAGGILFSQQFDFNERVVLAKVSKSVFHFEAYPGDVMTYRIEMANSDGSGAMVKCTSHLDGKLQAEIKLMFAILEDERFKNLQLFEPAEFCRMIRILRTFDVGVNPDGTPIKVPQHMLDAEKAQLLVGP